VDENENPRRKKNQHAQGEKTPLANRLMRTVIACIVAYMLLSCAWVLLDAVVGYVGYKGMSVLLWLVLWVMVYKAWPHPDST
jgi:ACR3 family arsenite efflux pump ArsB